MVDFGGWAMPVQYRSIVEEHRATRNAVGLFDVSHMGRLHFSGPEAGQFLDRLLTRRIADMQVGQIRYGLICNEHGGILDDVLVYRLAEQFQMVVNAGNRTKIVEWISKNIAGDAVRLHDCTYETAMIAVQGPQAVPLVDSILEGNLSAMRYYRGTNSQIAGHECYVSRTGYTGEDGCELIVDAAHATPLWETLMERGASAGTAAIGLGARDTLRLEAAMPLYGHELTDAVNPIQAGLGFALNLKDREFVGRDAILQFQKHHDQPVRIGLQLDGKRVPREGQVILQGDQAVGEVTSGTYSPTFERPIAMGYVKPTAAAPGESLSIDIRGKQHRATVVPLPFYQRGRA